jgi:hypothetical protein
LGTTKGRPTRVAARLLRVETTPQVLRLQPMPPFDFEASLRFLAASAAR